MALFRSFGSLRLFHRFVSIWDAPSAPLNCRHSVVVRSPTKVTTIASQFGKKEKEKTVEFAPIVLPSKKNYRPKIERSTSVVIMGTPNAGKSKLMNVLIGKNISAVSPKSHTTRVNVLGVVTEGDTQLVFCDTPGIMPKDPSTGIGRILADSWKTALTSDVAILLIDASRRLQDAELTLTGNFATHFKNTKTKLLLVLNKIDLVRDHTDMLPMIDQLSKYVTFDAVFMISSLKYDGVEDVKDFLFAMSKRKPWQFNSSDNSSFTPQQHAEEIIREKLYQRLNQEVPYNITQNLLDWRDISQGEFEEIQKELKSRNNDLIEESESDNSDLNATESAEKSKESKPYIPALRIVEQLSVSKASLVGLVVGSKGATLRSITQAAQVDMEKMFNRPVLLSIRVKLVEKTAPKPAEKTTERKIIQE